jgi:hypothetical protein
MANSHTKRRASGGVLISPPLAQDQPADQEDSTHSVLNSCLNSNASSYSGISESSAEQAYTLLEKYVLCMHYDPGLNLRRLGTGSFGVVYKAYVVAIRYSASTDSCRFRIHNASQLPVAIKQIDLEDSDDDITEIQQEISHLAQCDSPYVTRYYTSFVVRHKLWIGRLPLICRAGS